MERSLRHHVDQLSQQLDTDHRSHQAELAKLTKQHEAEMQAVRRQPNGLDSRDAADEADSKNRLRALRQSNEKVRGGDQRTMLPFYSSWPIIYLVLVFAVS